MPKLVLTPTRPTPCTPTHPTPVPLTAHSFPVPGIALSDFALMTEVGVALMTEVGVALMTEVGLHSWPKLGLY